MVDIIDIVTYTNSGDHRLRGFWVAGGQISPFPIDFERRPYNTLALPRECVMQGKAWLWPAWLSPRRLLFIVDWPVN